MQSNPDIRTGLYHGLEAWHVRTLSATAVISVFGGQLLSFIPDGQPDVLWLSPTRAELPTPIRGGVPVCWPWFGRQGQNNDVPAHGLVRTARWELLQASQNDDGEVELQLAPAPCADPGLRLQMQLRIGRQLRQQLVTENIGTSPVTFTQVSCTSSLVTLNTRAPNASRWGRGWVRRSKSSSSLSTPSSFRAEPK